MGMIERFISGYSENFMLAVGLWPLAATALTLPILAYLYHRDGRLKFVSVVSTYLAVLYLLGLGCFTLYPLRREIPAWASRTVCVATKSLGVYRRLRARGRIDDSADCV